jgi:PAP2 superfamily
VDAEVSAGHGFAGSRGPMRRLARALRLPVGAIARLDVAPVGQTSSATHLRRGVAALMAVYALVYGALALSHGEGLSIAAVITLLVASALYTNRVSRFLRDWVPVFIGLALYVLTTAAVPDLGLKVHYTPQIDVDRVLGFGTLPTTWLQEHFYGGGTGALEVFSLVMYISHFLAPLVLAFLLWAVWEKRGFSDLLFGLLAVSILADITFVLAPTAPPWLAAQRGLIEPVRPILTNALYDVHLDALAAHKGDASKYNVVAAIPSLHAAWPVICLLVIRKHRLPRWLFMAQLGITIGVFFAIVYTGEHYLVDALVGVVYALAAWWLLQLAFGAKRALRSAESCA